MTGAPMPRGRRHRVPAGDRRARRARVRVRTGPDRASNVQACAARTCTAGSAVVEPPGTALRPQELRPLASLGLSQVLVHQRARAWRSVHRRRGRRAGRPRAKPGQIYDSNRFTLRGTRSTHCGRQVIDHGIVPDRCDELRARLLDGRRHRGQSCVTSGGVSVGDLRPRRRTCSRRSAAIDFWQVAMQPGRPLAVGRIGIARTSSACPAIRSPRCWRSCCSCGRRSASWRPGAASCLAPFHARRRWSRCARSRAGASSSAASCALRADERWEVAHRRARRAQASSRSMAAGNCLDRPRGGARRRRARARPCWSSRSAALSRMPSAIDVDLIDRRSSPEVRELSRRGAPARIWRYADLRLEVSEGKFAARGERRAPRPPGTTTPSALGIRVLAGRPRMIAPGYVGLTLGAADVDAPARASARGPARPAYRRAMANARDEGRARGQVRRAGRRARRHAPASDRRCAQDTVAGGLSSRSARGGARRDGQRYTTDVSRRVGRASTRASATTTSSTLTQLSPRALRLLGGRAHRPVLRAHPGHVLRRGDWSPANQPGDLRRARPPARLGDPARAASTSR